MTFDNDSEPLARLKASQDRAHRAEDIAATLAADLQATRIALRDFLDTLKAGDTVKAINATEHFLTSKGLLAKP